MSRISDFICVVIILHYLLLGSGNFDFFRKYAIAVRCAMMTSQGCDHATTETLHMRFHEVMGHVGNMCPTVIRSSCKVETQCKVKEVPSCLMPLHKKIMASLQLPTSSTGQLCG